MKRCSRASQMMTRRGVKGESPPARHHQAIADAPPGIINSPSRVSNFHLTLLARVGTRLLLVDGEIAASVEKLLGQSAVYGKSGSKAESPGDALAQFLGDV